MKLFTPEQAERIAQALARRTEGAPPEGPASENLARLRERWAEEERQRAAGETPARDRERERVRAAQRRRRERKGARE